MQNKFVPRTDLALEMHEIHAKKNVIDGVEKIDGTDNGFLTTTVIVSESGVEKVGKPAGMYITADIGKIWQTDKKKFDSAAKCICTLLKRIVPEKSKEKNGCILVVGLGNEGITPDSVGPKTIKKTVVTRHIKTLNRELYDSAHFGCLAAIAPGVLGQTGVESAEIISAVAKKINPEFIIVIDALASRRLERLATTVQLASTGISPGSGVCNSRSEISLKTTGYPVISMGFPTVVDAATLAADLLEKAECDENIRDKISEKLMGGEGKNMFVAPKESDLITNELSRLAAEAINLLVHSELLLEDIEEFK